MEFNEKIVIKALPENIYPFYSQVSEWKNWDPDVVYSSIEGDFTQGATGTLKPQKGPEAKIVFTEVTHNKSFTTITKLPFCTITFVHLLEQVGADTEVTHAVNFTGFLSPLFGQLIGKQIKRTLPNTMQGLKKAVEMYDDEQAA